MSDNRASEGTPSPATPAPSLREATERLLAMEAEVEKFREAFAPPAAVSERWYVAKEAFEEAANPAAILALYAEIEQWKDLNAETAALCDAKDVELAGWRKQHLRTRVATAKKVVEL